jgi:hypothetical protein
MEENIQNNIDTPESPVAFPADVEAGAATKGDDTGQAPISEPTDGCDEDAVFDEVSDGEDAGESPDDARKWDAYADSPSEDYEDIFKFDVSQPSEPPIAPEPANIPEEMHSFTEDDFREQGAIRGGRIDTIWFFVFGLVLTVILMNVFESILPNVTGTEETATGDNTTIESYADKDRTVKVGTYKMASFNIRDGICTLSYFGEPMPEQPLSRVYIHSSIQELVSWQTTSHVFSSQLGKRSQEAAGNEHKTSLLFSSNYKLVPDANSREHERVVVSFVPETISSGDGKRKLEDVNGHWELEIHYWPARSEAEEYKLVEYKGNGTNRGTLTYELAGGATDTVEVFPYDVDVADDGRGVVEKRWGYVKDGDVVTWKHHWVVHSL